jgi:chorismate mutase
MNSDFLLVHKSILPDYFPRIIEARDMIARENVSVTEACKACKISRSAFYKYKDLVYVPSGSLSKKAILSVKADDFPGVLSSLLKAISNHKANVLTISQDMPIHGVALITLMINFRNLNVSLDELIKEVSSLEHIRKAEVLAYE